MRDKPFVSLTYEGLEAFHGILHKNLGTEPGISVKGTGQEKTAPKRGGFARIQAFKVFFFAMVF